MQKEKVWNPNLGKQAKKAGTTFKKWKSWNPKWRPKKGIALVNAEMEKMGYSPATKQDIEANYMAMIQLTQQQLEAYGKDNTKPMIIRIIAKSMLSGKGFDVIEKMLDRAHGKATQREETSMKVEGLWYVLSDEKQKTIDRLIEKKLWKEKEKRNKK